MTMEMPDPTFVFLRNVDRWVLAVERGNITEAEFAWKLVDELAVAERLDLVEEIHRRVPQQLRLALVDFANQVRIEGVYPREIRVGGDLSEEQIKRWEASGRMIADVVLMIHQRTRGQNNE